ncbi:hypothetical protein ACLOJK_023004 [Asimina triloba]
MQFWPLACSLVEIALAADEHGKGIQRFCSHSIRHLCRCAPRPCPNSPSVVPDQSSSLSEVQPFFLFLPPSPLSGHSSSLLIFFLPPSPLSDHYSSCLILFLPPSPLSGHSSSCLILFLPPSPLSGDSDRPSRLPSLLGFLSFALAAPSSPPVAPSGPVFCLPPVILAVAVAVTVDLAVAVAVTVDLAVAALADPGKEEEKGACKSGSVGDRGEEEEEEEEAEEVGGGGGGKKVEEEAGF